MNKQISRRFKTVAVLLIFLSSVTFAQINNMDFLKGGTTDAVKIIEKYFGPYANAFGAGLNGGWYNTAKPHKLGGFDIIASFNIGMVPASDGTFNVADLGLTTLTGTGMASTIAGPHTAGATLTKTIGGVQVAQFPLPPGTNWKLIPVPVAQVGVGLPLGTDIKIRYFPKLKIKDSDISLWGLGLMHSIMQYIPGSKLLPVDFSIFGAYTSLTSNIPLNLQPGTIQAYGPTYNAATSFKSQKMTTRVQAWNISALGSVKLAVITIYGGVGYSNPLPVVDLTRSTTSGVYTDAGVIDNDDAVGTNNLPDVSIKNFSGLRANIGLRLKLSVVTIHADYTRSQYNVLSAGLGISFR
jgi:hypothetical protein